MFGLEMLEGGVSEMRRGDRRRVGTEVQASGEPKESGHEGHAEDPRNIMAIR